MATITADGSKAHHRFTLTVTEVGTSTPNNTSTINFSFVLSPIRTSWDWYYSNTVPVSYSININGTTYSGNIMNYDGSSTVTIKTGSLTIGHNSDGSKSISISFSVDDKVNQSYTCGDASASGTMVLTNIPRKSTATISYSEASNGANAGTVSVNISRASSSFTHTVTLTCNGKTETKSSVGTATSFDIPLTWLSNTARCNYSITVDTYSGGTHIGSNPYSGTATVRGSIVPSIDFIVTRIQGTVPSDWGDVYIKNKSKYTLSITGKAGQGSAIKGYTIDGKWYSTNKSDYSYTSDFITKSGNVTITVGIEDERSRATKKEITISVIDYFAPAFKNVLSQRTDVTGVQVGNGNYFKSTYAVNFASCGGRNKYDVTIEYLMHGENQQYVLVEDLSAVAYGNNNILPDHSYTIRYGVKDSFTATPVYYYDEVSTEAYTMFFKKGGKGVSFGKACESDNLLETEWDFKFNKKLLQKNGTEVPYIVEQGQSGIWIYEKWSSGICKLYANISYKPTNEGYNYTTYDYPFSLTSEPIININITRNESVCGEVYPADVNDNYSDLFNKLDVSFHDVTTTIFYLHASVIVISKWK